MNKYMVLKEPHLSEKGVMLKEKDNKVSFKVHPDANKIQIKEAVESIFKVKVLGVQTINKKGKPKRRGNYSGYSSSWKKAIIKLKAGDKIRYFEGA